MAGPALAASADPRSARAIRIGARPDALARAASSV